MTTLDRLDAMAGELGPDELAGLRPVVERLKIGHQRYGELRVAADRRDFGVESLEETADGLVDAAVALVRGGR